MEDHPDILQVPVFLPWHPPRRSSPQEDFLFTLTGVRNLMDQQSLLLSEIQSSLEYGRDTKDDSVETVDEVTTSDHLSPPGETETETVTETSSSMQTLRRILEMEELFRFTESLGHKLQVLWPDTRAHVVSE